MNRTTIGGLVTVLLAIVSTASADYVGTAINRILLDPASQATVADGYQNGDVLSFILETTPRDTGSTLGVAAWGLAYIPLGAEVVGAELVQPAAGGSFIKIPAKDVGVMSEDCGPRGCQFPTAGAPAPTDDAPLGPCQQDTGIFYSTDARTALAAPVAITPTGSGAQMVYNTWDLQQVQAFGDSAGALSGNGGTGNTALVNIGGSFFGTGSPVAGPDAFCTKDYNPACNTGSTAFNDDAVCDGPWQRIAYPNAKKGGLAGGGPLAPATTNTGVLLNNSTADTSGFALGVGSPLPAATNAVRYVRGIRRLGDIEYSRITLRITNATQFVQSVFVDKNFCLDATGSDTDLPGRGAQDNNWRYYEGNPHTCLVGSGDGVLSKLPRFVNGKPSAAVNLTPGDIVGFEITFTNTSGGDLTNVVFSDQPGINLTLVAAGTANCPYASYDGEIDGTPGIPTFSAIGPPATWNAIPTLVAGSTAKVFVCGQVSGAALFKEQVKNVGMVDFSKAGVPQPQLMSPTLGTISSLIAGTVFSDSNGDGLFTAGELGIDVVTVELFDDSTGTVNGAKDAGDTLLRTTTTAPDGSYSFSGFFGDLLVVETDLSGFTSTGDIDTAMAACGDPSPANGCNGIGSIVIIDTGMSVGNDFFDKAIENPVIGVAKQASVVTDVGGGSFDTTFTFTVKNLGDVALSAVQLTDNLAVTFPSPATFSITAGPSATGLSGNAGFTGSGANTNLLSGTDTLAIGASATVGVTVRFRPNGLPSPFNNTATASGRSPMNTLTTDISDDGVNPDPNGNGNPGDPGEDTPTPVPFTENPVIGVAKQASAAVDVGGGSYETTFTFLLENLGNVVLSAVQLTDDLALTFPNPVTFSIVSAPSASGGLTANSGFTGAGANDLLVGSDTLAIGATATVSVTVRFTPTGATGPFMNTATARGQGPAGGVTTDVSDDGTNPDPSGDNNPGGINENTPTPISIAVVQSTAPRQIPTLRVWSGLLLIMLMLLLANGWVKVRSRR